VTRRRVYHFGPDPADSGGIASVLSLYRRYQIGGDVRVVPTWASGPSRRRLRFALTSLWAAARLPDSAVVHVHLSERGSFIREGAILALARRRRLPTAATLHGAEFLEFSRSHRRLAAWVLGRAQAIVCLSNESRDRVRAIEAGARIFCIPNPVVVDYRSPPASTTAELVLFAGEVGLRKGADVLERAWAYIAPARPRAECILVGPPTSLRISSQARLVVRPLVPPSQMRLLLQKARVVVLPSRAEAMPMILLEAQASRRPFVATPVGAIPALAQHGGVLVPVGDARHLATAVIDLLEHPERANKLGRAGQAFVRDTRSVEAVHAGLEAMYDATF
jgi:glycosyltransferase involved in cell wall biosynthesis